MSDRSNTDSTVERALLFIDRLKVDENRNSYWEVAEQDHSEHKVFPQTQYLLYITFNRLELSERANRIAQEHDFAKPDQVDVTRDGRPANDNFCVLERKIEPFHLAGDKDSDYNDQLALLTLYWLERRLPIVRNRPYRKRVDYVWKKLLSRYDGTKGVLEMDPADRDRKPFPLYAVYKVALLGIAAQRVGDNEILISVRDNLRRRQDSSGGWITDLASDLKPNGVTNLETTCLCILALAD